MQFRDLARTATWTMSATLFYLKYIFRISETKKQINKLKRVPSRICKQVKFPWVESTTTPTPTRFSYISISFTQCKQTLLIYGYYQIHVQSQSVCPSVLINITCLGYVCRVVSGDKTPPATPTPTPWSVPRMGIGRECFRCYWCIYI